MTNSNKPSTPSLDLSLAIAASANSIPINSPKQSYLNSPSALSVKYHDNDNNNNKYVTYNEDDTGITSATTSNNNEAAINGHSHTHTHTHTQLTPNPYIKHDFRVLPTFSTVPILRVDGLSRVESRTVLEYYAKSGMLRTAVDERLVAEVWTLAGGGVVGELERMTARLRI